MTKRSKRRRSNDDSDGHGADEGNGDGTTIDSSKLSPILSMLQPELQMLITKLSDGKPMTNGDLRKLLGLLISELYQYTMMFM